MLGQMLGTPPNGAGLDIIAATEAVIDQLRRTETNEEFLQQLVEGT
jgi:transcription termination factor Rho